MNAERLPVVYISGSYRAATMWKTLLNIQEARRVSLRVWEAGAVALCPHANTAMFDGEADDRVWLEGDLELIRRVDAVMMCDAWKHSAGACAEREFAQTLGLPIFYDNLEDTYTKLPEWIHGWKIARTAEPDRRAVDLALGNRSEG
jgi:hypothetical protein